MKQKSQHRLSIQLSPVLFLDLSAILKDSPKLTKTTLTKHQVYYKHG
jgi:hypothetical protein